MTLLFQLTLFSFIALSFLLVVGVPVAFTFRRVAREQGNSLLWPRLMGFASFLSRCAQFICCLAATCGASRD